MRMKSGKEIGVSAGAFPRAGRWRCKLQLHKARVDATTSSRPRPARGADFLSRPDHHDSTERPASVSNHHDRDQPGGVDRDWKRAKASSHRAAWAGCGSYGRTSTEAATARRPVARSDRAPAAIAWTRMLPRAVASAGPATTGLPQASAVNWQSIW